jgi:hypothetical protein
MNGWACRVLSYTKDATTRLASGHDQGDESETGRDQTVSRLELKAVSRCGRISESYLVTVAGLKLKL